MIARFSLLGATMFWGANFHFANVMLGQSGYLSAGFWRYLIAVIPLALIVLMKGIPKRDDFNLNSLIVGVVGLFGFNYFFFTGMENSTPLNAALIISLNPATTLVLSRIILKSVIRPIQIFGTAISLFGVLVLLSKGSLDGLMQLQFGGGEFEILIANLMFAFHHVWIKRSNPKSNLNFTFFTNLTCLFCFILILPLTGSQLELPKDIAYWWAAFGMGILGTTIAFLLWNKGISIVGPTNGGLFMNVVPLTTAIISVVLGAHIHWYHAVSGLLLIVGISVTFAKISFRKRQLG